MNGVQSLPQHAVKTLWRVAADNGSEERERPFLAPEEKLPEAKGIDAAQGGLVERVAHEILDGAQHARHELGVLGGGVLRCHVFEHETRLAMDQKHMLDAEYEGMPEHHLGKRGARAVGLHAPLQALPGQAVLERLVQGLKRAVQRLRDRLPDRGNHERREEIDQRAGIATNRRLSGGLDHGRELVAEPVVLRDRPGNSRREHGAHRRGELVGVVELLLQAGESGLLRLQEDVAQCLDARIGVERARHLGRDFVIDASRHFQQEVGEQLSVGNRIRRLNILPLGDGSGRAHQA